MKCYKIRNKETGEFFSTSGYKGEFFSTSGYNHWDKNGKIYSTLGTVKSLLRTKSGYVNSEKVEIVEYELKETRVLSSTGEIKPSTFARSFIDQIRAEDRKEHPTTLAFYEDIQASCRYIGTSTGQFTGGFYTEIYQYTPERVIEFDFDNEGTIWACISKKGSP